MGAKPHCFKFIESCGMIEVVKREKADKFFNVILNSIADGVFTTDSDGRITFFNKAAEQITGFSSREALGRFCFDIFRADICQARCAFMGGWAA